MRTALFTLLALSTLAPLQQADACGSYIPEPAVHQLSTHFIPRGTDGHARSFVVLGGASDEKRTWKQLAPMSYDGTQIARGLTLEHPMTFTLVGRDGTKVVTGRKQVFLSQTFAFRETASAIEVPASDERSIAIEGSHADAKWIELDDASRWNDIELVPVYDASKHAYVTVFKRDGQELMRRDGRPLGVLELAGEHRVVLGNGAWTATVAI
jgi:hypothetical protein